MSEFDPNQFLNGDVKGGMDTEFAVVPEGEWPGQIKKVDARTTQTGKTIMDVTWGIQDEAVAKETGMDEPSCRQSVFLDIDDSGQLSLGKGKNVTLGKLRAAVGQNDPKQAWNPNMLIGQQARVTVKHRITEDGTTFADVKGTAPF